MLALLQLLFVTGSLAAPLDKRSGQLMGTLGGKKKLTFDRNGNFKVVSFSDMHFGERWGDGTWASWGPSNDAATQNVHATVLDQEKPNYVVFNGDMMTGENVFADNATGYLDQCYKPTVDRNIPFSSTHGNHDNANNINHNEEIEYEQAHYGHLSYTRSDVGPKPYGNGNYWVPVYAKEGDWKPALIMWFFDSRSFVSGTGDGPGPVPDAANYYWVDEHTVPAYIQQQALLMDIIWGGVPPSLVFVHIPFQRSDDLYQLPTQGDHDDEPDPSTQGYLNNTYTGLDNPTFQQILKLSGSNNNVLAITSGHDHGESWCARSKASNGITLCFDGHSGYGGYVTTHSQVRNGRVFNLNLKDLQQRYPSVETWNSYENKTINDKVTLNNQYLAQYN
ncbi:Metallo-dependent phosphatase-like protein [Naematelia encephala]|uniref:Metallo-dependent phosphatase-like protein n=1 Tax=Naematelia encephala TaxID=71784 RepID=A0A1Y2ATN3_9TREE|nr:Metallo-dependent phosphatase-like protein [Naematelia encephala]